MSNVQLIGASLCAHLIGRQSCERAPVAWGWAVGGGGMPWPGGSGGCVCVRSCWRQLGADLRPPGPGQARRIGWRRATSRGHARRELAAGDWEFAKPARPTFGAPPPPRHGSPWPGSLGAGPWGSRATVWPARCATRQKGHPELGALWPAFNPLEMMIKTEAASGLGAGANKCDNYADYGPAAGAPPRRRPCQCAHLATRAGPSEA